MQPPPGGYGPPPGSPPGYPQPGGPPGGAYGAPPGGPGGPAPGGSFELQPADKKKFATVGTMAKVFGGLSLVLAAVMVLRASVGLFIQGWPALFSIASEVLQGLAAAVVAFSYFTASKAFSDTAKSTGNSVPGVMEAVTKIGKAYMFEVIMIVIMVVLSIIIAVLAFVIGVGAAVVAG